ncbi:hypothetical protein M9H77_31224 [Catharanthus roseus]|uniref:Uncharacterized protein n=1 Tax=Catharanthus roseus TaxID=4058 RepID=A0ACC0A0S5_CATRO|nr:hypothetical protein M9H77_31224 [Catharanthus roseus]
MPHLIYLDISPKLGCSMSSNNVEASDPPPLKPYNVKLSHSSCADQQNLYTHDPKTCRVMDRIYGPSTRKQIEDHKHQICIQTSHHALQSVGRLVERQEELETKVGLRTDLVGAPGICSLVWPVIWRVQLLWKSSARIFFAAYCVYILLSVAQGGLVTDAVAYRDGCSVWKPIVGIIISWAWLVIALSRADAIIIRTC